MIALLQRVSQASVHVDGELIGAIGRGLLVLVCAEHGDSDAVADKLLAKILKLRVFAFFRLIGHVREHRGDPRELLQTRLPVAVGVQRGLQRANRGW